MTFSGQSNPAALPPADEIAAALDWWREAGVDCDFAAAPQDWLAAPAPAATAAPPAQVAAPAPSPPAPPAMRIGGKASDWPQDLAGFTQWWITEPSLDSGQVFARVPPRGPREAPLLLLVDHPEAEDSKRLLSGPQGRLLASLVTALGLEADAAYYASALPRHMPLPDWTALARAGLGEVVRHHLALAAPARVIAFGSHVSSLLGHDPAKSSPPAARFFHLGGATPTPVLAAPALSTLLTRPQGKAGLWQALLDWPDA